MAKALDSTGSLGQHVAPARTLSSVQTLRLAVGLTAAFGAIIFFPRLAHWPASTVRSACLPVITTESQESARGNG